MTTTAVDAAYILRAIATPGCTAFDLPVWLETAREIIDTLNSRLVQFGASCTLWTSAGIAATLSAGVGDGVWLEWADDDRDSWHVWLCDQQLTLPDPARITASCTTSDLSFAFVRYGPIAYRMTLVLRIPPAARQKLLDTRDCTPPRPERLPGTVTCCACGGSMLADAPDCPHCEGDEERVEGYNERA